jgi:hypothetical protein
VTSRTPWEGASLNSHDRTPPHPRLLADNQRRQAGAGRAGRQHGCRGVRSTGQRRPGRSGRADTSRPGGCSGTGAAGRGSRRSPARAGRRTTQFQPVGRGGQDPRRPSPLRKWVGPVGLPARCVEPGQGPVWAERPVSVRRRAAAAGRRSSAGAAARIRVDERAGIRDGSCRRATTSSPGPPARVLLEERASAPRILRPATRTRGPRGAADGRAGCTCGTRGARAVRAGSLAATATAAAAFVGPPS